MYSEVNITTMYRHVSLDIISSFVCQLTEKLGKKNVESLIQIVLHRTHLIYVVKKCYICGIAEKTNISTIHTYSLNLLLWIFGRLDVDCFEVIELSVDSLISVLPRSPSTTCITGTTIMQIKIFQ